MGCVSSHLLNHDEDFDFPQLGSSGLSHHIVSLTSTTYGLLSLDPPPNPTTPPTPSPRFTLGSIIPSPLSETKPLRPETPEIINSWELMAGLDTDSFRFSPLPQTNSKIKYPFGNNKENSNPNSMVPVSPGPSPNSKQSNNSNSSLVLKQIELKLDSLLDRFERLCPPNGENKVVIYTTTLRGVRKTFEDCNAVRAAAEGFGVAICERDVSMDSGFREELRELMKGREKEELIPPRVFVRGRYLGGAEEVLRLIEDGYFKDLVDGLPKRNAGLVCEGCGGVRFLPCFQCNGSCKMVMEVKEKKPQEEEDKEGAKQGRIVVLRCPECNENGLVLCPICS